MAAIEIIRAEIDGRERIAQAAVMFREYASTLGFSLAYQGFEAELAGLPGRYASPRGRILLAEMGGEVIGCVALREIGRIESDSPGAVVCEMKRMYVRPAGRGRGVGRLLAVRLIEEARAIGYTVMKLDSDAGFDAAIGLYRSLGFVDVPCYNDDVHPDTVWMGKVL